MRKNLFRLLGTVAVIGWSVLLIKHQHEAVGTVAMGGYVGSRVTSGGYVDRFCNIMKRFGAGAQPYSSQKLPEIES